MFSKIATRLNEVLHPAGRNVYDARKAIENGDPIRVEKNDEFTRVTLPELGGLTVKSGFFCVPFVDAYHTLEIVDPNQAPTRDQAKTGHTGRVVYQNSGLVADEFSSLIKARLSGAKNTTAD